MPWSPLFGGRLGTRPRETPLAYRLTVTTRSDLRRTLLTAVDPILGTLSSNMWLDWVIAGVVVGADYVVVQVVHHGDPLRWGSGADRVAFYTAADTVVGIVVGFTIAALAFFYTVDPGRRLRYVKRIGGDQLRKVWIGCLTVPLMAVLVFTVAILVDNPDVHVAWIQWLAFGFSVMVVLRFARLVWLFSQLLDAATKDSADPVGAASPVEVRGPRTDRSTRSRPMTAHDGTP